MQSSECNHCHCKQLLHGGKGEVKGGNAPLTPTAPSAPLEANHWLAVRFVHLLTVELQYNNYFNSDGQMI